MGRLTNKKLKTICDGYFVNFASREEAVKYRMLAESAPKYEEIYRKLADYEDAEEQGLIISLPCNVGDKVYQIGKGWYQFGTDICEFVVTAITISKGKIIISVENENKMGFPVSIDCIGKRLYLTRSEAEEALAKIGDSHGTE